MKAIMYDLKISKVIRKKAKLAGKYTMIKYGSDWPKPSIKHPKQVLIRPTIAGICASDIHQIQLGNISYSSSILARKDSPYPLGHEVIGIVEEVGNEVEEVSIGDRVTHSPIVSCACYGFDYCESCKAGKPETCQAITGIGDGSALEEEYGGRLKFGGFGSGGFSEYFVTYAGQLQKVPEGVPDDIAILSEPLAVAIHAVKRKPPTDDDTVLVIGAGIIGLMIVRAIRGLGSKCKIVVLARYPFQEAAAKKLGADEVIPESKPDTLYQRVADSTEGHLLQPLRGNKVLYGGIGPDIIFDSVGSDSTLNDSLHLVKNNGAIVIVGMDFGVTKKTDWILAVYKQVDVLGSMMHGLEEHNGGSIDTFELAFEMLQEDPAILMGLVTHKYRIDDYKTAFSVASNKGNNKAIKVAFDFGK
ncbi:MAG: zinc-dependent alcohol dehydrogenase [Candidatus Thorarchaeota archaeon]|jgi:threonine dehydrogenase-like Zn-dependent dehydrogenase